MKLAFHKALSCFVLSCLLNVQFRVVPDTDFEARYPDIRFLKSWYLISGFQKSVIPDIQPEQKPRSGYSGLWFPDILPDIRYLAKSRI